MAACRWLTSSSQTERHVISALWDRLDYLLSTSTDAAQNTIWLLQDSLPRLDELDPQELPTLAKLHMHSAGNLMATIKLLAPGVFVDGAVHPDHGRVAELEGSTLGMVNTLIELQLFQLRRASALVQHSKNKRRTTLHIVELPRRSSAPAQLESGACVECE